MSKSNIQQLQIYRTSSLTVAIFTIKILLVKRFPFSTTSFDAARYGRGGAAVTNKGIPKVGLGHEHLSFSILVWHLFAPISLSHLLKVIYHPCSLHHG
jgi:hypothetical protein